MIGMALVTTDREGQYAYQARLWLELDTSSIV
jgi:hypothetical protein